MDRDEILNMTAGKSMDTLIAKNFMRAFMIGFYPSQSITSAWMVVQELAALGFNARIEAQDEVRVTFWSKRMTEYGPKPISASAKTAPLAICRAALLVMLNRMSAK